MANTQKKNAIYIDSTGDVTVDSQKPYLMAVKIIPSSSGAAQLTIKESGSSGTIVFDWKSGQYSWTDSATTITVTDSRPSGFEDFSNFGGIELTTTFNISTVTNCTAILYGKWRQLTGVPR